MKQKTYIGIVVSFVMAIIFGMEVYASSHETNINFPKQSYQILVCCMTV